MIAHLVTSGLAASAAMVMVAACELLQSTGPARDNTGQRWVLNISLYAFEQLARLALAPLFTALLETLAGASPLTGALTRFPLVHLALILLALDAAAYGLHWASHHLTPLWRLHAIHHSDRALDVTTAIRHHPAELLPTALVVGGCGALIGATPWEVALYGSLAFTVQLIAHAELRLPPALLRAAGLVLVTPAMHALHHSRHEPETNSNYGEMFSVWDRLFGSLTERSATAAPIEFGLDAYTDTRFHSVGGALLQPLLRPNSAPLQPRPEPSPS